MSKWTNEEIAQMEFRKGPGYTDKVIFTSPHHPTQVFTNPAPNPTGQMQYGYGNQQSYGYGGYGYGHPSGF